MVARRLCFLDDCYAQAGLREEHGGGASAGTATNNRDIGFHSTLLPKRTPELVPFESLQTFLHERDELCQLKPEKSVARVPRLCCSTTMPVSDLAKSTPSVHCAI